MQGIGVIFGEGGGGYGVTKKSPGISTIPPEKIPREVKSPFSRHLSYIIRHHNGHSTTSQRSFYAITTDYNLHQSPITTSSIRHHWHISTLIQRNPTDHLDIPVRSYPSHSLSSIIRISIAISTVNIRQYRGYAPNIHRKYFRI